MPENREMISKVLEGMSVSPVNKKVTIPGYDSKKPYKLHIKEVRDILKPKITIVKEPIKIGEEK